MNKEQFIEVLQSAIMWWNNELPTNRGISPQIAKIGMKIADDLRKEEIK